MPKIEHLHHEIENRYAHEAVSGCNLSCGSNLGFAALKQGETILDLGCGRGEETFQAAALSGPKGKAVGLDLTPQMVDIAQTSARERNITNAHFLLGSIEKLPFENNVFDVVISNCVINHARDKALVFREIYRVLASGGRFIISDAVTKHPLPELIKKDPGKWAECFGGAVTEQEYLETVKRADFHRIEILTRREYLKNGYDFASLTIRAWK